VYADAELSSLPTIETLEPHLLRAEARARANACDFFEAERILRLVGDDLAAAECLVQLEMQRADYTRARSVLQELRDHALRTRSGGL
jgi:hypothetical protein